MDRKLLILLVCAVGVFILLAAATGGNEWLNKTRGASEGLWKTCGGSLCFDVKYDNSKFNATRAFAIIAVLAAAGGTVVSILRLFKELDVKLFPICFIVAGVCMMIAMSIYTDVMDPVLKIFDSWGWGYYYRLTDNTRSSKEIKQQWEEEALLRMRSKSCPPIRLHHQHISSNHSRPSSSSSSKYEESLQDPTERLSALSITGSQISKLSKKPTTTSITTTELHFEDKAVNTPVNFYSLQNWHGASWQKCLPLMYLPRKEKYNAFASSKPVRSKARPARFRHTDEMANLQN